MTQAKTPVRLYLKNKAKRMGVCGSNGYVKKKKEKTTMPLKMVKHY
jgi:hypothetical protein